MAQVVLSAAGSAAASSAATSLGWSAAAVSAASAVGGFIGSQVGGLIDSAIMGKQRLPDVVGPRANDLMVQVSTYGTVIPKVFGVMRLAGNVIWSTDIKETEIRETHEGGGKGGGGKTKQTAISYEYSITMAIAICEGEIDEIIAVWADSKLLDITKLDPTGDKYNIYTGSETQNPDSIIESFEGAGNVPAYRGMAYVVLQDFPLADYGNRIPNFTFEVKRTVRPSPALEDKIKSVILIPGSGEFVYSTDVTEIVPGVLAGSGWAQAGPRTKANMHNLDNKANVLVALDQLERNLPNLEWVAVVVNWFATSKDPGILEIIPKVEFGADQAITEPFEWEVAGITRDNAEEILHFGDGTPTYGGTPSDKSIVDLCVELKDRGYNVMLYPMPLVDTIDDGTEDDKPWRGRIVPSSSAEVTRFFSGDGGYNAFIRHYAQLEVNGVALKDNIDAFVIGSELVGLTTYDSGGNTYPAVTALKTLAGLVKTDLSGTSVLVTYAADWSEYHSVNGYYHLDPLWTDSNIDFVGIDCYVPITPDLPQSQITEDKIKEYWEKGEGWDYFYTDPVARTGLTSYGGDPTFAWKNIEHWWNSSHNNPGPSATGWTAKMKPIWFTEYGFPSVDGAANQPNVFYDPSSIESFFPRASKGRVDFRAQRQALNASEDFLEARNQESGKADLVPQRFVWTWDARPYPFWPSLSSVWADYRLYKTGHWIQGKIGVSNLGAIVAELLETVGFTSSDYDVSALIDQVEGYVINNQIAVRSALEQLQRAYFFDAVESDGQLVFVKRGGVSAASITEDELVPNMSDNQKLTFQITRIQDLDLPQFISLVYINRQAAYEQGTQISQRQTVNAVDRLSINLPLVLADQEAKTIADIMLYNGWVSRTRYSFKLPPKYARVEPTDLLTVTVNGVAHLLRVTGTTIARNGVQEVTGIAEDVSSYDFYTAPGEPPPVEGGGDNIPVTDLELLDLPPLPTDTAPEGVLRLAGVGLSEGWRGAFVYRSDDGGESGGNTFGLFTTITSQAVMGSVINTVGVGPENMFDMANTIDVVLVQGTLASVTELAVLNGANVAVVGDEIIQFQTATLTGTGRYTLSKLLRGRLGTEHEMSNHAAGDRFVLLDTAVVKETMPVALFNLLRHYKPVTAGAAIADTDEQTFTYRGKTLKPFSPVQITGERDMSDNLTISWVRRTRLGGEWRDGVDVPLSEETEAYEVDIMDGSDVVRTILSTSATCSYSAADQTTDFGSPQSSVTVRVYQMSAVVGRGTKGEAVV